MRTVTRAPVGAIVMGCAADGSRGSSGGRSLTASFNYLLEGSAELSADRYHRAMAHSAAPDAHGSVTITADPAAVYALITDLATMASLAEETDTMQWRKGNAAAPGAVFTGNNRNGSRTWTTKCTVTAADPGRAFAFDVHSAGIIPIAHWRYDIESTDGGCMVTEATWDRRPRWILKPAAMSTGISDRTGANTEHIKLTLQRLKERAEAG